MKRMIFTYMRPLVFGLALGAAATTAQALPRGGGGTGCAGGDDLAACAGTWLPVWWCCMVYGM